MLAPVNKIIKSSVVDGPGNRCAIFFQACNFRCWYCHNPETMHMCLNCGDCVKTCPAQALCLTDGKVVWDKRKCVDCDTCIRTCKHHASPKITYMTPEEVMDEVRTCMPFITGITTSGGECTLNKDFLVELFRLATKEGLTCLIDSNGSQDFSAPEFKELIELSDGVMLDIKATDPEIHKEVCGMDNSVVLKNAEYLAGIGKLPEVRTVCAREHLHNEETVDTVSKMLAPYLDIRDIRYRIIRFRPFGVREEYKYLGSPDDDSMEHLKTIAMNNGFKNILLT